MNQRVHSFISGCLTLKLSLSWKTVTGSSELFPLEVVGSLDPELSDSPSFVGEIGMVSSGTGEAGLPLTAEALGVSSVAMTG